MSSLARYSSSSSSSDASSTNNNVASSESITKSSEMCHLLRSAPGPSAILVVTFLILIKSSTDIVTNYVTRPPAAAMALAAELMVFR